MDKKIKKVKLNVREIPVILRIGKNGITDSLVEEVKKHLKKRRSIKIKLLKAFTDSNDRKEAVASLASLTNSKIVENRGNTLVLTK